MKSRQMLRFGLLGLLISSAVFSSGCNISRAAGLFGPNMNLGFVIPLGFGGTPGVFNPFGITQAIVNSLVGATAGDSATGGGGGGGSTFTLPPGVIPSILN